MTNTGYVYVMVNPSMEGMVKIGKTNRDPYQRAQELSAATGVPTPFIHIFDELFDDCSVAETFVHTYLERNGYRVSGNREFFRMPVKEAIIAIMQAKSALCHDENIDLADEEAIESSSKRASDTKNDMWIGVYNEAEEAHYGLNGSLRDIDEAIKLYSHSARLGGLLPYLELGNIYRDEDGYQNKKLAIQNYKIGAEKGLVECYAEMSKIYSQDKNFDNAIKCWNKFFNGDLSGLTSYKFGHYGLEYMFQHKYHGLPLVHLTELRIIRDSIRSVCNDFIEKFGYEPDLPSGYEQIKCRIDFCLFDEISSELILGEVDWFDNKEEVGYIRQKFGEKVFFHSSEITNKNGQIHSGQQVRFLKRKVENSFIAVEVSLI